MKHGMLFQLQVQLCLCSFCLPFYCYTSVSLWHTVFEIPDFCCGWSTVYFKCSLQDSVFPFGQEGCTFHGTVLSCSAVKVYSYVYLWYSHVLINWQWKQDKKKSTRVNRCPVVFKVIYLYILIWESSSAFLCHTFFY